MVFHEIYKRNMGLLGQHLLFLTSCRTKRKSLSSLIFFGKLDTEKAVGPLDPPSGPTFGGVFEVPNPYAPAWRHAQISAPK